VALSLNDTIIAITIARLSCYINISAAHAFEA
ncbi:MAG: hypothetical protein ACI9FB_004266, partial [Candidatus Azotimanducaceae bacterium]